MSHPNKIIMLGATGAVGNHAALVLSKMSAVKQLTLLDRRAVANVTGESVVQHSIDVFSSPSYEPFLTGHDTAICTLGVDLSSKMSKEEFIKTDKDAVLDFASACKKIGVIHFELLSSVSVNSTSSSFYLRIKGELEDSLKALGFARLSLFHPSMIMTPTNRYGLSQAMMLSVMPLIDPLFIGRFNKFRIIPAEKLGTAIAMNLFKSSETVSADVNVLHWDDFIELSKPK
jgi:uncharacterized protein YbjT (DUF2867 family)